MLTEFSDEKIVSLLGVHSIWAKKACREILSRKQDFVPLLLDVLDKTKKDPSDKDFGAGDLHIPAALLLAQMREPAAYAKLIDLIAFDSNSVDILWGDILTDLFDIVLRDTFDGDLSHISQLLENRSVSPWSRVKALEAWGMHFFDGHISREDAIAKLRYLINEVYCGEAASDDEIMLSQIADVVREQRLEELLPDIKKLFDRKIIDPWMYKDYEHYISSFNDLLYDAKDEHFDDTIKQLQKWKWFDGTHETVKNDDDEDFDDYEDDGFDGRDMNIRGKIERNAPCPCGSGKKYKKCCGA